MKTLLVAAAAALLATPASAATLREAVAADMPQLMALYRDLHANPELSMQEVRSPAKLAAEARKLGFRSSSRPACPTRPRSALPHAPAWRPA